MRLVHRLLLAASLLILNRPASAAPADIVPRGDIAYDLLGSLASAGRIPGYTLRDFARGDRLYTRAEVARLVVAAGDASPDSVPEHHLALSALQRQFGAELRLLAMTPEATPEGAALLTGSYKLRGVTNPAQGRHVARLASVLPVGRDGFAAVTVGSYRYDEFDGPPRRYPSVETAFVRIDGRALDVTIGIKPQRWGPGYSGALLFSDTAAAFPHLQVEKSFVLPGTLGRRIGRLYFSQFGGQFFEEDVPTAPAPNARGTRRFVFGRRLETQGGGRWTLALREAFKSTRLPDPLLAFLLPFYTYQTDWTETNHPRLFGFLASGAQPNTFWMNYFASAGLSYRADGRGTMLYGDYLIDDVKAPAGLGLGNRVPRKTGAQIGVYLPDLGGIGRYAARLEFSSIDQTTFTNVSEPVAWRRDELPLGFPAGPNTRVLFGRIDARLSDKVRVAVDASIRRRKSETEPGADVDSLGAYATYALRNNAFIGTRLGHQRIVDRGVAAQTRTRFEVNAGVGF